jgi:hypothetical protein
MAADEAVMFIIWCVSRRLKKKMKKVKKEVVEEEVVKAPSRKYSIHPCFNRSGELGSFVLVREPGQDSGRFESFYR